MTFRSVGRFPLSLIWTSLLLSVCVPFRFGFAENPNPIEPATSVCATTVVAARAYPFLNLGCGMQIAYSGAYSPEGKYEPASKMAAFYNQDTDPTPQPGKRPVEVPPWFNLHPRERVVENFRPPAHATSKSKGQSFWEAFRDDIVTFAYGHERPILGPHHVIVDSTGRVILTDPTAGAVHVLDGSQSFQISAGRNKRLVQPNGIAVDALDNIYVADSEQGLIVVFDRFGKFLRYIGQLSSRETLFHLPTGIAIDRRTSRLYVLDSERHLLFILDLQGHELRRVGRFQGNDTVVDFMYPTEIAVGHSGLAIMDDGGSRIWTTDLDGLPTGNFRCGGRVHSGIVDDLGLAIDDDDRIYVSRDASVKAYDLKGHLRSGFGTRGSHPGEFETPTGLWIDSQHRLFVADEAERRIQVFRLTSPVDRTLLAAGQ